MSPSLSLVSRALVAGLLVVGAGAATVAGGPTFSVQNWYSSAKCSGTSDFGISTNGSSCLMPLSSSRVNNIGSFAVQACAGGYVYLAPCDNANTDLVSYAAGSCYSNGGSASSAFFCSSSSVGQSAGATLRLSSSYGCALPAVEYNEVSANLNTCLFAEGTDGRAYYKVTGCEVDGKATIQMYSDATCATVSGAAKSFDAKSTCNTFPALTTRVFSFTCYAAGKGPVGPQGSGDLPDSGNSAPSTGASALLSLGLTALAVAFTSGRRSMSFGLLVVLAVALFSASGSGVSAADTYTVRVWQNSTNCWASSYSTRGSVQPDAMAITTTNGACMSIKTGASSVAYFQALACSGDSATFAEYSDAACTTLVSSTTGLESAACQSLKGTHSFAVSCGRPTSDDGSTAFATFFSGSDCTGIQTSVSTGACTAAVIGGKAVFLGTTCGGTYDSPSLQLTAFADPNCRIQASVSGVSLAGTCAATGFGGSFQLTSQNPTGGLQCGGGMISQANEVHVSFISFGLAAAVALLAKRM